MGMIRGVIKVTDNLDTVDTSKADPSIPAPSSGMSCCGGGAPGASAPSTPSIYGDNLSLVPTDRLVKKETVSGSTQTISMKGIGYEFEPLIVAADKSKNTKLALDLTAFDNPEGKFQIIDGETNDVITSFTGKKGVLSVDFNIPKTGTYVIAKGTTVETIIELVDDVKTVDIEKLRSQYLGN